MFSYGKIFALQRQKNIPVDVISSGKQYFAWLSRQ